MLAYRLQGDSAESKIFWQNEFKQHLDKKFPSLAGYPTDLQQKISRDKVFDVLSLQVAASWSSQTKEGNRVSDRQCWTPLSRSGIPYPKLSVTTTRNF
jgi:hypothetical protein